MHLMFGRFLAFSYSATWLEELACRGEGAHGVRQVLADQAACKGTGQVV
jgi:hypothetical protein